MIESLFPTPLWHFQHPDPDVVGGWANHVLQLQTNDPQGLAITNQGGWHSQTNLLDDQTLAPLFNWIAAASQHAFVDIGWDFSLATPTFNNAWAMVNGPGHTTRAHLHPSSLFSGVVYLQVDEGAGSIAFLDPRGGAQMLCPPFHPGRGEVLQGRIRRQPLTGLMLLFPSWLWHEVEPSAPSSSLRISISFNVGQIATRRRPERSPTAD